MVARVSRTVTDWVVAVAVADYLQLAVGFQQVAAVDDSRLRVVVDGCHLVAVGDYPQVLLAVHSPLLQTVLPLQREPEDHQAHHHNYDRGWIVAMLRHRQPLLLDSLPAQQASSDDVRQSLAQYHNCRG